jgi:hypothetical protein
MMALGLDAAFGAAARRDPTSKVNWVFSMRDERPDYVVLGSSRAYSIIDTQVLDSILKTNGLNFGQNGASFAETALLFDVYSRRNHPRHVLLEVDPFGLDSLALGYPFHEYLYLAYGADTAVTRALREYYGVRALIWLYVPLFRYAEFNDRIGLRSIWRVWNQTPAEYDMRGLGPPRTQAAAKVFDSIRDTTYLLSEGRIRSLKHILETARLHGLSVTMFTATDYLPMRRTVRNRAEIFDRYRSIGRSYGATFLEVSDSDIAADRENFGDPRHLNRTGRRLFSQRLAEALLSEWATAR